jgi:hypothetical protein
MAGPDALRLLGIDIGATTSRARSWRPDEITYSVNVNRSQ